MQGCSEKLFYTVIIDISMVVENVKLLVIAEKLYIYIYIYIYIIHLTYLYSYSIITLYHSVVSKHLFVFSMFDWLLRQRMCCHGNSESFHKWRLRTNRTHQDSPRSRSTNSTSTDFGKSSLYLLLGICIGIAYSSLVSLATVIPVLKPE